MKLLHLLHDVLVDGLRHVDDLEAVLLQPLDKGRLSDNLLGFAGDEVDGLLVLLHARHVV